MLKLINVVQVQSLFPLKYYSKRRQKKKKKKDRHIYIYIQTKSYGGVRWKANEA